MTVEGACFYDDYFKDGNIPDEKELNELKWTLQRQEIQKVTEFESLALHYKSHLAEFNRKWSTELAPSLASLCEAYQTQAAQIQARLSSPEHAALSKIIELERVRRQLKEFSASVEVEIEWRTAKEVAVKAMDDLDLDLAQKQIEELDRLNITGKHGELDLLREQFVKLVRSSV